MAANSSTCFARSGLLPFCPVFAPGSETCQNVISDCPGITVLHNHQVFPEQPDVVLLPLHVPQQLLRLPRLLLQRLVLNFKSIVLLRKWWIKSSSTEAYQLGAISGSITFNRFSMSFLRWLSIDLKLLLFCERSLQEAKIEQFTCVSLQTTIGTIESSCC